MTFEEQLKQADGHRFQKELGEFIIAHNIETVVETGLGVSTLFILDAMDKMGKGHLYSIDPNPWYAIPIEHPRLTHIKDTSISAMFDLYVKTEGWDLVVSDGNHEVLHQTYEYHFGYNCLKKGGWLVADDTGWNNNGAWGKFIEYYSLDSFKIGGTDAIQKSRDSEMSKSVALEIYSLCLKRACDAEEQFLANGGKFADCFK